MRIYVMYVPMQRLPTNLLDIYLYFCALNYYYFIIRAGPRPHAHNNLHNNYRQTGIIYIHNAYMHRIKIKFIYMYRCVCVTVYDIYMYTMYIHTCMYTSAPRGERRTPPPPPRSWPIGPVRPTAFRSAAVPVACAVEVPFYCCTLFYFFFFRIPRLLTIFNNW